MMYYQDLKKVKISFQVLVDTKKFKVRRSFTNSKNEIKRKSSKKYRTKIIKNNKQYFKIIKIYKNSFNQIEELIIFFLYQLLRKSVNSIRN